MSASDTGHDRPPMPSRHTHTHMHHHTHTEGVLCGDTLKFTVEESDEESMSESEVTRKGSTETPDSEVRRASMNIAMAALLTVVAYLGVVVSALAQCLLVILPAHTFASRRRAPPTSSFSTARPTQRRRTKRNAKAPSTPNANVNQDGNANANGTVESDPKKAGSRRLSFPSMRSMPSLPNMHLPNMSMHRSPSRPSIPSVSSRPSMPSMPLPSPSNARIPHPTMPSPRRRSGSIPRVPSFASLRRGSLSSYPSTPVLETLPEARVLNSQAVDGVPPMNGSEAVAVPGVRFGPGLGDVPPSSLISVSSPLAGPAMAFDGLHVPPDTHTDVARKSVPEDGVTCVAHAGAEASTAHLAAEPEHGPAKLRKSKFRGSRLFSLKTTKSKLGRNKDA